MNTYTTDFFANCPSNGVRIKYTLSIQTSALVMVEDILEFITDNTAKPVYQEALADAIAGMFPGLHTMRAHHHGVDIETRRCGGSPAARGATVDSARPTLCEPCIKEARSDEQDPSSPL